MNDLKTRELANSRQQTACRSVLMVGTVISGKGGIGSVLRAYQGAGIFETFRINYVATHCAGGKVRKSYAAIRGWLLVFCNLCRMDAPLVHIHLASRASFWRKYVVCRITQIFRRPYVLHLHGGGFMQFYSEECGPTARSIIRTTFRRAKLVMALSNQWRVNILQICPDATVEVLPNAVPLPDLSKRGQVRSGDHANTILFMGRLGQGKGTYDLIRSFARVASNFPSARLICAGDGDLRKFRKLASELGVADRVKFPGWLSPDQCSDHYASASIFALPSYAEGLPISLLEAMSWQLAVVASPVGGIPELLKNGKNGILVDPGDVEALTNSLETLLMDTSYRGELARAARTTIENSYSIQAHQELLGRIYATCGLHTKSA